MESGKLVLFPYNFRSNTIEANLFVEAAKAQIFVARSRAFDIFLLIAIKLHDYVSYIQYQAYVDL